jgi:hypothetical protein
MAHAHSMLDTWGYKRTLRICNTYCFSTAALVARKRYGVTLYVHCLSFLIIFRRQRKLSFLLRCWIYVLRRHLGDLTVCCLLFKCEIVLCIPHDFFQETRSFQTTTLIARHFYLGQLNSLPCPVAARSKASFCGRSVPGITSSNLAGVMDVCRECCVLSGRGLCDGLIARPEKSYQVCVSNFVWPRNLVNEAVCSATKRRNWIHYQFSDLTSHSRSPVGDSCCSIWP